MKIPFRHPLPCETGQMRNLSAPAQAAMGLDVRQGGWWFRTETVRTTLRRLANAPTEFLIFWTSGFQGIFLNNSGLLIPMGLFSLLSRFLLSSRCLEINSTPNSPLILYFSHHSLKPEDRTCTCTAAIWRTFNRHPLGFIFAQLPSPKLYEIFPRRMLRSP